MQTIALKFLPIIFCSKNANYVFIYMYLTVRLRRGSRGAKGRVASPQRKPKEAKEKKAVLPRHKVDEKKARLLKEGKWRGKPERSSSHADLPYTGNYSFI